MATRSNRDPDILLRREKAGEKAEKLRKKYDLVQYQVEDDNIRILSGPYAGFDARSLWFKGPAERDYIVKHIWFSGNREVAAILSSLSCK